MKTVRILNGVVVEVIPGYALPIEKYYSEEFCKQCRLDAPEGIEQGWTFNSETKEYKPERNCD